MRLSQVSQHPPKMMNMATVNQMETWVNFRKYTIYPRQALDDSFINLHAKEDEGSLTQLVELK